MVQLLNIALCGASGNLDQKVLQELIESNKFNITVLVRSNNHPDIPASVATALVNYQSIDSLTSALKGKNAVVSTLGTFAISSQKLLIEAAVAAGVQRFIPSEFGSDTLNEEVRSLPVYKDKLDAQKVLADKAADGAITYTLILNNAYLDWGLDVGFLLDIRKLSIELRDGGDQLFSTTKLSAVGKAVVGVLTHPNETANRAVYIHDIAISQKKLLKLAQAQTPGEEWEVTEADTAELVKQSDETLRTNPSDPFLWYGYIKRAIWGQGLGGHFQQVDNSLLGIPEITEAEVSELLQNLLKPGYKI
ncbi:uncharacterized protein N7479_008610 [Penicillium vulpinum]|uniref:NmrA-like domain-containing protein n=1 Tax=Penicillium vulpinum TaxID=29845 RepID=A0A1V6RD70_9EURO|nr:uncharacterized protein N7479_008610 [Penicillium vulpinum]KAJ5950197.1 hypothetical protein N7479_008610 [Penicillium vulpinum]OQD99359.1 hypothetical protein PENVUL_c064G06966 [Penicillium vulpinum]